MEVKQFYSKSKDEDDLNIDIPDWRKHLSNFYPVMIKFNNKIYPSVEHLFQSEKIRLCSDKPEMSEWFTSKGWIGKLPSAVAKSMGGRKGYTKYHNTLDIEKWNTICDDVMKSCIIARLEVDPTFKKILEATKKQNIYLLHFERQGSKSYWGGVKGKQNNKILGQNILGHILMDLRHKI